MSEREAWQVSDDAAVLYETSFVPAIFARSAPMVADAAGIGDGDRVLDVGCGTGIVAREAAKRAGAAGRIVGLDLNPRMLEVAKRVAPEIEWRHGDAAELPFGADAFDAVASQYALMFFPDPSRALGEMWRVLAPGGRLAVAVCGPIGDAPGYHALAEVAEEVCPQTVVEMLQSPFALGVREKLSAVIDASGIGDAEVATRDCAVRFPSIDALVRTEVMASPVREVIDEAAYDALLARARKRLAVYCRENGEIAFSMSAHLLTARKA